MRLTKNSIKRDLVFGIILKALVFASALIVGGPFLASSPAATAAVSAVQAPAQTTTLNGTVTRNGARVYLNDGAGTKWQLDNTRQLGALVGRYVMVTGVLNSQAKSMHVERIETIDA
jgi:hypothetical protein